MSPNSLMVVYVDPLGKREAQGADGQSEVKVLLCQLRFLGCCYRIRTNRV